MAIKPNPQTQAARAAGQLPNLYPGRDEFHADPEAWAWLKRLLENADIDPGESLFWICYQAEGWRDCVPLSHDILERIIKAADRVWGIRAETARYLGRAMGRIGRTPTRKLRGGADDCRTALAEWRKLPRLVREHMPFGAGYGPATLQETQENHNTKPFTPHGCGTPQQKTPETAHCKEVRI